MVQNNKVLTVSYGTFSCTLEGFEESFDTMKAIAEYFRDLAADDRYFGAEPPQPDAEMLARIAQREITRQVEARTSDAGIHLRASENPPSEAQNDTAAANPETSTLPAQSAPPQSAPTQPSTSSESPVEDVHDISSVTASVETAEIPETSSQPVEETENTQDTETTVADVEDTADLDTEIDSGSDAEAEIWGVEEALTDVSAAQTNSDVIIPEPEEEPVSAADSIAAKLMRIRSVVTKSAASDEDFTEDQHAESLSAQDAYRKETLRDLEAMLGEDDQAENVPTDDLSSVETHIDPVEDQDIDDLVSKAIASSSEVETDAAPSEDTAPRDIVNDVQEKTVNETAKPVVKRGRVIRVRRKAELKDLIESTAKDVQEPEPQSELASSIAPPAAETPTPLTPEISSSLSDDEEQELIAELAAVEAELRAATQPDPSEMAADASDEEDAHDGFSLEALGLDEADQTTAVLDVEEPTEVDTAATILGETNALDGDVSRLMATAGDKLNEVDTAESRATYNQLRAAVAAAQADTITHEDSEDAKAQVYREDLAEVVRPRRPSKAKAQAIAETKANAKTADRLEPLQLVAAQRIDPKPSTPRKTGPEGEIIERRRVARPISPRRISSDTEQGANTNSENIASFAEFALDQGATELSELLEAAASYLVQIEGREHFSRPQLLKTVRNLDEDSSPSREDSLRAFGQLLRKGKLDRAENGRFTINAQTAYSDRAAG